MPLANSGFLIINGNVIASGNEDVQFVEVMVIGMVITEIAHRTLDEWKSLYKSYTFSEMNEYAQHRDDVITIIDASGCLVVPGFIDPHVHLDYPQGGNRVFSADDFYTGTAAALAGGTTTLVDFFEADRNSSGTFDTYITSLNARKQNMLDNGVAIDVGFHASLNILDDGHLSEIPALVQAGCSTFKIYMCYDGIKLNDKEMLMAMKALSTQPARAMIHAENDAWLKFAFDEVKASCSVRNEPVSCKYHEVLHPADAEAEAVNRILFYASHYHVPTHIVHVSSAKSLDYLKKYKGEWPLGISGEVCSHHLMFTRTVYDDDGASDYVMAPPPHGENDRLALWNALECGLLSYVVTDHCPFTSEQRHGYRTTPGFEKDIYTCKKSVLEHSKPYAPSTGTVLHYKHGDTTLQTYQMPGGVGGIELRPALAYDTGVVSGRMTVGRWVDVVSTAAAKLMGIYPRKGAIMIGSDADIVIFNPSTKWTVNIDELRQRCDHCIYDGYKVTGKTQHVIARGTLAVVNGAITHNVKRGTSRFLCTKSV